VGTDDQRYVLISGATSGIGAATARRFAAEGWNVAMNGRRKPLLDRLLEELPKGDHLKFPGDYSADAVGQQIAEGIGRQWGRLDVLVNSAGISQEHDAITSSYEDWRECFDVMVGGAVRLSRVVVPLMSKGGRIIHVTSVHGQLAWPRCSSYAMAKAAINQWCRNLAVELADRHILVNAIAPGFVDTPMSSATGVNELETERFRTNYVDGPYLPLRRAAQPEEIAGVAFFLAGQDSTYITGQVITVDGGLSITS
jgi:NAD(P)-dependent dehydrogenase (short-subunit alcohol dehydrogenase family)